MVFATSGDMLHDPSSSSCPVPASSFPMTDECSVTNLPKCKQSYYGGGLVEVPSCVAFVVSLTLSSPPFLYRVVVGATVLVVYLDNDMFRYWL